MKVWTLAAALSLFALAACQESSRPQVAKRAEVRKLTGNTVEIVPTEGQLPYCLMFTITDQGKPPVIRQLTMTHENRSVPCEPGKPIGGISYRIPVEEGKVRILVLMSDQKLNAGSIAQQIYELAETNPRFLPMDLRANGQLRAEAIEFVPTAGGESAPSDAVTGGTAATDGGSPTPAGGAPDATTGSGADAGAPAGAQATPQ